MNPEAMDVFGKALLAFFDGDHAAELIVRRDDGEASPLPVSVFFREPQAFTPLENAALNRCLGRVLDVGAGSGLHSLELQRRCIPATAIDISPQAVRIMNCRGLTDVHCADLVAFYGGPYDTVLLLGHGIGMVETIAGLDRFLIRIRELVADGGQVLLDSLDVRKTDDPNNLSYQEVNRRAGRYFGEIRMRFEFRGAAGPYCGWLHIDSESLAEHARSAGWRCETIHRDDRGDYLARLTEEETP